MIGLYIRRSILLVATPFAFPMDVIFIGYDKAVESWKLLWEDGI